MTSLARRLIGLTGVAVSSLVLALGACSSNSTSGKGNGGSTGGAAAAGGGGATSAAGAVATGGGSAIGTTTGTTVASGGSTQPAGGSTSAGGTNATGGTTTSGGSPAIGGSPATGGSSVIGSASGGTTTAGGTTAAGGRTGGATGGVASGGTAAIAGSKATGGTTAIGGSTVVGGTTASGGNTGGSGPTGGTTGTGGATGGTSSTGVASGGTTSTGGIIAAGGTTTSGDGGLETDTSSFHCVNWADPGDNFQAGVLQPTGLSSSDSYATVSAKADAILSGFQTLLSANSIRIPINEPTTTNAAWWAAYKGIIDTAISKSMKVIIGYWYKPGVGTVQDMTAFYAMWKVVVDAYGTNDLVYFDIINEPSGYSASAFINLAVQWIAQYPSVPKNHVVVAGTGTDTDVNQQGADSRLAGCLLSLHLYPFSSTSLTEQGWRTYVTTHVGSYYGRTIATEYGAPMTTGLDYAGPIGTTVEIAYMQGVPNQFRDYKMGSCLWVGLRNTDFTSITSLNGTGTNLSLTVNNTSGLARLQWGWGL
jgi:endoglucanase